jgi:superfamily II DNA/RNA helicase
MFSATMPEKIYQFSKSLLNNPTKISIALSKPSDNVDQGAFVVFSNQKIPVLVNYLSSRKEKSTIIFSSRKSEVNGIQASLKRKGFDSLAMSSDLEQADREFALNEFRNQKSKILVATDVMSRGIDIKGVDVVINFDVPGDAEDYVHRIGRTGRADAKGEAVTFIVPEDQMKFKKIEKLIGSTVNKLTVEEQFGEVPAYNPQHDASPKKRFWKKKK